MRSGTKYLLGLLVLTVLSAPPIRAQTKAPASLDAAQPIPGALVIHGGGTLPDDVIKHFLQLAGGQKAKLIVIPTASASADKNHDALKTTWQKRGFGSVTILHTHSRKTADSDDFIKPLTQATAVWFGGGLQSRLAKAYVGTAVERQLHALLKRGGVIGGTSAGAAIMSRVMIRGGKLKPEIGKGLGLIPNAIIDQHFTQRKRQGRLIDAVAQHPGLVGYGIDERTSLVVRGRGIYVLGESKVSVYLGKSKNRPLRLITLSKNSRADLVALSRAAIERTKPAYPPAKPPLPIVKKGTLIIVGGGTTGPMLKRFIKAAGGPDQPIVIVPTAIGSRAQAYAINMTRTFKGAGATNVSIVHATLDQKQTHPQLLKTLAKAKGVWFTGGRQWRLVDSYLDTKVEKAFHDVLARGGVIGGSSAGATIQGDYLVRGNPLGNREMMSEGYERGFAFLPGVTVDQHFTQRNRFKDLELFKKTFPQIIALGIDEFTAVVVSGHTMEVIGRHKVAVYDRPKSIDDKTAVTQYTKLKVGDRYDFKTRSKLPMVTEPASGK